jgi:hypothetical protein
VMICPVRGGLEGPISNPAGTYDFARAIAAFWNHQGDADSYNIYFYDAPWLDLTPQGGVRPGATVNWVRKLTHNNSTIDGGDYPRDFTVLLTAITDGTDALTGVATSSVDQGHGVVKPIYVGIQMVDGAPHHKGLVSRCAVKEIQEVYLDGIAQHIQTDAAQSGVDGIWLIPGYAGWNDLFADPYEDINGRRYTVIYGKVGYPGPDAMAGTREDFVQTGATLTNALGLTLNVLGIETNGDTTGDLITRGVQQALWFANNFIAPDTPYQSGAYLTASDTQFTHIPGLTLVDEESLDTTDLATEERIGGSPGVGYEGAGIIGANGEFLSAIEALARFAVSYDFDWIWTRKGQLGASIEPIVPVVDVDPIDDVISIVDRSFRIQDLVTTDFFNIHPFVHTRDYVGSTETGWGTKDEVRDTASITNYDQEREAPLWELHFGRDETDNGAVTIADVMQRKRARFRHPRRRATLRVPLSGLVRQLGEAVPITHVEGIGAAGWEDHQVRIVRDELDPNDNTVVLECYDLETVYEA